MQTNGSDHIIFTNCVTGGFFFHVLKSIYRWLRHIQMQSRPEETIRMVKKEADCCTDSCHTGHLQSTLQEPIEVSSSNEDNSHDTGDIDDPSIEDSSKQLVLYDPVTNGAGQIEPVPQPIQFQRPFRRYSDPNVPSRVLPSVGTFTVQCAKCFKWRLIPTKKKYEELREHILEEPFFCEIARGWRPDISCDDPTDITQDGSRLWAIDKPNIAQPPPGWQRLLRIRGEGSSKFADVYYQSPSGKRLRSMVEVQKYLIEHPEYMTYGVTLSQFSFQIPKPLQENYVRKRRPSISASCDYTRHLQPGEGDFTELQLGRPASPSFDRPVKKKAGTQSKQDYRTANPVCNQDGAKVEELDQSRNSGSDL